MYSPDVNYFQEMGDSPCSSRSQTPEPVRDRTPKPPPKLHISTNKVSTPCSKEEPVFLSCYCLLFCIDISYMPPKKFGCNPVASILESQP